MYRVTIAMNSSEHVSLRVANQDLARFLTLATRLQFMNPGCEVTYTPEAAGSGQRATGNGGDGVAA